MNATQAENLRILIRHMETSVERILRMSFYFNEHGGCGTPACALGEACVIPALQRRGLNHGGDLYVPMFNGDVDGRGIKFFGLSIKDSSRLFGTARENAWEGGTVTPQEWAAEARKVLAKNGYSMDAPDDGFGAFMEKVREPVAVEA